MSERAQLEFERDERPTGGPASAQPSAESSAQSSAQSSALSQPRQPADDQLPGGNGPYDVEDAGAPDAEGALDFGSLRVPMPARAQLQVEKGSGELLRAVHVLVPSGRVSLSALAAPRTSPLWRELAEEIATSLGDEGARVRSEWGQWGREVQAGSNGALSRFVGVDGPRWMLYGVATGPAEGAAELAYTLREMIRGTVVTRGPDPLPVKTVLPLRLPEHLEDRVEQARRHSAHRPADAEADTVVALGPDEPDEPDDIDGTAGLPAVQPPAPPVRPGGRRRPPSAPPEPREAPRQAPPHEAARPAHPARSAPGHPAAASHRPQAPTHPPEPGRAPLGPPSQVSRSIGLRRVDQVPAGAAPPSPPGARQNGPSALPPVPAISEWDTQGFPKLSVESTWSMAIPVVSADAVENQPAWAQLTDAPSFWPDPYPVHRPLADGAPEHGGPGERRQPPPPEPAGAPEPAQQWEPGQSWEPEPVRSWQPGQTGQLSEPLDRWDPGPPAGPIGGPDQSAGPLDGPLGQRGGPAWPEPSTGAARPTPSDSLHDALTSDIGLTRDRPTRVPRRGRHRRPD